MIIGEIYNNKDLYGDALISLPHQILDFAKADFTLYLKPDPGTYVVEKDYLLVKKVHFRRGNTLYFQTESIFYKHILNLIEFVVRRILGSIAAALSFAIFTPIGLVTKLAHFSMISAKIDPIWKDANLYGHTFTSAPEKCYRFAAAPLTWHLRPDGTDRRSYVILYGSEGKIVQMSEYELVPFEVLEFISRRILGGAAMLIVGIISPIGLITKCIHQISK